MLKPGMMLCDRYEILEVVGAGGMSIVYKARCHRLNRNVAIKVLKPEFSNDKNFVTKFRIEAQASAGLTHPNIVNVYDVYDDDGIYFIVMELVEGITLKEYIAENGRLPMDKAIDVSIQIASGLEAAHESHIIHRDIKPQNIIVAKNGTVKVTDFGIARAASPNTLTSGAVGSVHYISPEQARGGYSDERSDIYSLGITMYEMVTGRVPFDGDNNVSIALMHIQNEMIPPRQYYPDIYSSFEKIILKATQKKPERRYLTASALIADLKRVQNNPNIDIVVAATAVSNSPTQEWTKEDVQAIREGSAVKDFTQEPQNVNAYADNVNQTANSQRNNQHNQQGNPYGSQYVNQPIQNNMGELKSNAANIPVNNERINQLLQEEEIPWEDEEEPVVVPPRRNGGIKKVQDYDDDADYDDYDYDNDGDGDLDPKLKKGVMIAGIASAVVIALIILVLLGNLAGWFKFGSSKKDSTDTEISTSEEDQVQEVDMISVVGYAQDKALELLTNMGLTNVTVQTEENTSVQEGYVFDQSVKENTKIKTDFEVILKVASAAEQVDIPDVTNYTDQQAKTVLEEAGFVVAHSYEYSEDVEMDKVIRTEPAANTQAEKGSKVIMVMSNGSEVKSTSVPSIVGMTEAQAINALNTAKLSPGAASHQYDDNVKQGYVISQSLDKDTEVDEGTSVDYVISDGPEPKTTTYTANITARLTAPADGSLDGQAVTVQVVYGDNVIYEAPINSITSGSAYDVTASQPGLADQNGQGSVVIKDASGNDVTSAFSPSVNTSFTSVTE
jgi:serine/threonine-protein kinase